MPTLQQLRGLRASDRTEEEQKVINQQMGYEQEPETPVEVSMPIHRQEPETADTVQSAILHNALRYKQHLDEQYEEALAQREEDYGIGRSSINSSANDYLDNIASEVSSYYKKYNGTDKLSLSDQEKKQMAAAYDARKKVYGEDNANIWLDQQMKDKVAENQSWWEQGLNAISHLVPAIEGGAIQAYGMVHGAINHVLGTEGYNENPDLNWWDSFMNDVIDNPVTRYGRDVELAGASNIVQGFTNAVGLSDESAAERIAATKASATKYNPEGIGNDAIVTTSDQDDAFISSATPWQALQSGGFTALSMLVGAGEAKVANWLFNGMAKGANWLNATGKALKSAEALEKALVGIKKAQNFTDTFVIPAAVGTMEGGLEGLSTKIDVEREAVQNLDQYYRDKVNKEVEAILNDDKQNPLVEVPTDNGGKEMRRILDPNYLYQQVWDKYKDEYIDARRQIDWAASKAGIHNFYANSLINGAMNQTLKAGLMAPRVQETLRNSRAFGWAYRNPKFNISPTGEVTARMSKAGAIGRVLKEPVGEGTEEYAQSLSNDIFSGAAENNIDEFIKNKFEGDGTAKVTDSFGSDYAAALTALEGSLVNKESIQSAILGAVSSTMGTVGGIGRGYHRDENGNLVRNSLLDPRNLTRGLDSEGNQESWFDYARRVTPWRSGAINAYFDRRQEMDDANETAATLTEWLKDPQNKAKWDGLTGTANWMAQMENAAESNDQFSYRKAQMGKAVNDIFMLKKIEGTDFYDTVMADLQKAANGELSQEEITKMRQSGGEDYQNISDQELVEKVQSNANKMLGLMTQVEQESKSLNRLIGRMDEDTKQSLIFGKIMEQDFKERRDKLQEEIDTIKGRVQNSRSSNGHLEDELTNLIMRYGSLNHALHEQEQLQSKQKKLQQRVEELEAIDPSKTSDKQKEELIKSKQELKRVNKQLESFDALYEKDEKGKKTDQIDSSLAQMVLNEQDIMSLDPVTRAIVLAQGATKLYNATHQNRQRVDQLNLEIDEINNQTVALEAQMDSWITADGRVKKGHNKQYTRNAKKIEELQKQKEAKMRELDAEQGKQNTKSIYNSAQQEVIDNLVQQGMAQDADFLDKVVDMGRLEKGIKDYHQQYQAILSDPKAFQNYVQRAKYNAQRDLTRRRAERIANIQNFQEYSQELDRLTANASQQEMNDIMSVLREQDVKARQQRAEDNTYTDNEGRTYTLQPEEELPKTNFQRYTENIQKQGDLIRQFAKNPNLTDNDQSLLIDAMQYLSSKGIDVTDREAAVEALIERDEQGNQGGKFRQFVEAKNDQRLPQQRTFMPVFTSIGQVVSQYVDLLNGQQEDAINRGNLQPTVQPAATPSAQGAPAAQPQVSPISTNSPLPTPSPAAQPEPAVQGPSLLNIGYASADGGQFVDGDGTVATGAQTQSMQQKQEQQKQHEEQKSVLRQMFEQVTTPEIAKMVDDVAGIINNSNESAEVSVLARQYLIELAVNGDNNYSTLDDLLTGIQSQINRLNNQSDMQENDDNNFSKAAGLLQKVYGSLSAKKLRGRKRSAPMPSSVPANPRAAWIHTANIAYMERQNPNTWAVRFTDSYAIDEWNRDHVIDRKEPIYFITDSDWTAEVTAQMNNNQESRNYDTLTDMPIVAAVRVEAPQNPANSTAIEVDGLWYQPIGVMPSSKSTSIQGAAMTEEIRKVASKEQGRHLVTANGLPNGQPLITHVYGVNYLTAHHPDASSQTPRENNEENNSDIIDAVLRSLPRASEDRLRAMSKQEMLADPEYQEARSKFLDGLQWNGEGSGTYENQLTFIPDNYRQGEMGNPMIVFIRPMAETTSRNGEEALPEVLNNGTLDQVVTFNSRTERLFNEIIRPLFQYLPMKDKTGDKSAKLITQTDVDANPNIFQEEADRLTKMLNGFDGSENSKGLRGISDFIYVNPKSGWSLKITAPEVLQTVGTDITNSESVYKILFMNNDPEITPIEVGTITMNASSGNNPANNIAAMNLLKNIMWDGQQVRDFLNWQVPKSDAQNLKNPDKVRSGQAKRNYAAIVDDGILTLAGSSIVYDVDGVKLNAPITVDGQGHTRIVYPQDTVASPTNAQPAAPQNITPQGDGAIIATDGQPVDPDSGANLGGSNNGSLPPTPPRRNPNLEKAEAITKKIVGDSKQFTLSEDETYYYILDKNTGEEVKYLRVTTVIGADESVPQWTPTVQQIYDKLKERHALAELDVSQVNSFRDINHMSQSLGIPAREIRRAVAELRTNHKKEKYGAWSTPSTSIGNSFDTITRDFLAGHLKTEYPNISQDVLSAFVHQLTLFKNDLDSRGIHIVSEGVMAYGTITMTDEDEKSHDVKVAGTLDLFGYDDNGNFYIFDMKTTRKHTDQKLQDEKAKWSRQVSMYADLLKQTYGIDITPNHLRIIPINVNFPTPMGKREEYLDPTGPAYSETAEGQLQMTYRGHEPEDFKMTMPQNSKENNGDNAVGMRKTTYKEQFQPGYTRFNINWDNLSSEDQDIASALITQTGGQGNTGTPAAAHIETPQKRTPSFMDMGNIGFGEHQEAGPTAPPIVPSNTTPTMPEWRRLSKAIKGFLAENYAIETVDEYNDMLNDPALAEAVVHDLKCHGLM